MAEFYRFPQWILTALVMIVAVCIALQTLAISYSFRRLPAGWARKVENGMECAVLAALFFFAALLGQVQYGLYGSFLLPSAYGNIRQVVFLLCAVLGAAAAVCAIIAYWDKLAQLGSCAKTKIQRTACASEYDDYEE